MKLYISADIEGTTGITRWDETENGHSRYPYFAEQMTREVAAAINGALQVSRDFELLVKDAHDSACNLIPSKLPASENLRIFRGWGSDAMSMMGGLERGYDGVFFIGYHSGAIMPLILTELFCRFIVWARGLVSMPAPEW